MIKTIRVQNLGPFAEYQTVALPEGIISIEGRYAGDSARSNRAGKTFFVTDLISFALFGQHRFDTMEKMIHRNFDSKSGEPIGVSLLLADPNGEEFALSRYFDKTLKRFVIDMPALGTLEQVAAMKQKELQESINQVLGCDYQHACLTWLVRQNVVGAKDLGDGAGGIMDLQASDRKQFLLDTFTSVSFPWGVYYAEAMQRQKTFQARLSALETNMSNYMEKIAKIDLIKIQADIISYRNLRDEATEKLVELEAQRQKLKESDAQTLIVQLNQKITDRVRKIGEVNNSMSTHRRQLPVFEKMKQKVANAQEQLLAVQERRNELQLKVDPSKLEDLQQKYGVALKNVRGAESDIKSLSDRLNALHQFRNSGSVCPVTLKDCAAGSDVSKVESTLTVMLSAKEQAFKEAEATESKLRKQLHVQEALSNEFDSLAESMDHLGAIIDEGIGADAHVIDINKALKTLSEELRTLNTDRAELQRQLEEIRATSVQMHQQQILAIDKRIVETQRDIAERSAKIVELQGMTEYLKQMNMDVESIKNEMLSVTEDVMLYKTLSPALSKDGVPFYALINSISEFEYAVNKALHSLGSNLNVMVQPYTELNTLEPICQTCGFTFLSTHKSKCPICGSPRQKKRRETLAIQFKGSSFNVDFNEDSGGGRLLVSLAIRLALFSVFKQRGMMDGIDFWVLDEVFSPLDAVHKTSMLQFMEDLGSEYGLKQIFVISHTDISDVIPPTIVIERDPVTESSTILC